MLFPLSPTSSLFCDVYFLATLSPFLITVTISSSPPELLLLWYLIKLLFVFDKIYPKTSIASVFKDLHITKNNKILGNAKEELYSQK